MKDNLPWIFVDDAEDAASAYSAELSRVRNDLAVHGWNPNSARTELLSGNKTPTGVLLDVDLQSIPGELGTGPGIAQDLRVKQRAGKISEFPVVRFAGQKPVAANLEGDPASDDLFDLKIAKESLRDNLVSIVAQLKALEDIYGCFNSLRSVENVSESIIAALGVSAQQWERWGDPRLEYRLSSGLTHATHIAVGDLLRNFLLPAGLLVSTDLLAIRLGVHAERSGQAWSEFLESLPFRYGGIGASAFPGWWAKGIDEWWSNTFPEAPPLASMTIQDRIATLQRQAATANLVGLEMPKDSPGDRPWRLCILSCEMNPPKVVPVDPAEGVRVLGMTDNPPWVDLQYAALGPAVHRNRIDFRLNRNDLSRLAKKFGARL